MMYLGFFGFLLWYGVLAGILAIGWTIKRLSGGNYWWTIGVLMMYATTLWTASFTIVLVIGLFTGDTHFLGWDR